VVAPARHPQVVAVLPPERTAALPLGSLPGRQGEWQSLQCALAIVRLVWTCLQYAYQINNELSTTRPSRWADSEVADTSGWLTGAALSRLAIMPDTPIATFVKRLRCSKCGGRSVLATRKPPARPQRAS